MARKLYEELRTFCETTSVRGIPRIFRAQSKFILSVWLIAVLACSGMLAWQLATITTRYLQYPVGMQVTQAPSWENPTFPDITLCNLSPLIYDPNPPSGYTNYARESFEMLPTNAIANQTQPANYYDLQALNLLEDVVEGFRAYVVMPQVYLNECPITSFTSAIDDTVLIDCALYDWNDNQ